MNLYDIAGIWVGALLTLCIFSIFFRYNRFFRFAESLYVGVSIGYVTLIATKTIIDGLGAVVRGGYALIPVFAVGLLLYGRLAPARYVWISRYPVAILVGTATGIFMRGTIASDLKAQVLGTFLNINTKNPLDAVNNLIIIILTIATITYFLFTREHTGTLGRVAGIGRFAIMVALGAAWGSSMLSRFSLMIDAVRFLIVTWLGLA